jgi:arsenate reductase-like glutaredoxin family protein
MQPIKSRIYRVFKILQRKWRQKERELRTNGQSGWLGQAVNAANGTGARTSYGFNFQRYMVPWVKSASGEMDAARAFSQFDIDKDPPRLEELRQILDVTDPDLSAFRKHGGQLLMYFGWADPQLNAKMGVEYYEQVVEKMGPSTDELFRLLQEREDKNRGAQNEEQPGHRANHQRRAAAAIPASPSTNRSVAACRPRFAC